MRHKTTFIHSFIIRQLYHEEDLSFGHAENNNGKEKFQLCQPVYIVQAYFGRNFYENALTHYHTVPHFDVLKIYIAVETFVRKGEIACNKEVEGVYWNRHGCSLSVRGHNFVPSFSRTVLHILL